MMSGCFIHIWLFCFAVFAREFELKEVKTGLYSRVELTGEELDQHIANSLGSVEWTKLKGSVTCLCLKTTNTTSNASYSHCCGTAHFYLNNNSLILENVTAKDEGVFTEMIILRNGTIKSLNFTLIIQCKNSTVNQGNGAKGKTQSDQIVPLSGITLTGVLGLCIVFYCFYKYHHGQRAENGRTTDEGGADNDLGIYQEVPDTEKVTPLPYVYTDFIKPKESSQASAAAQHFEDFGYSEVGPTGREETIVLEDCVYSEVGPTIKEEAVVLDERVANEQSTACPGAGEE